MHKRNFVLFPLFEIQKDWLHPIKQINVKSLIYLTPLPYLIDFPANLLSGNPTNISRGFSMQILWILLLFPVFKIIWTKGTKKYTAMGS